MVQRAGAEMQRPGNTKATEYSRHNMSATFATHRARVAAQGCVSASRAPVLALQTRGRDHWPRLQPLQLGEDLWGGRRGGEGGGDEGGGAAFLSIQSHLCVRPRGARVSAQPLRGWRHTLRAPRGRQTRGRAVRPIVAEGERGRRGGLPLRGGLVGRRRALAIVRGRPLHPPQRELLVQGAGLRARSAAAAVARWLPRLGRESPRRRDASGGPLRRRGRRVRRRGCGEGGARDRRGGADHDRGAGRSGWRGGNGAGGGAGAGRSPAALAWRPGRVPCEHRRDRVEEAGRRLDQRPTACERRASGEGGGGGGGGGRRARRATRKSAPSPRAILPPRRRPPRRRQHRRGWRRRRGSACQRGGQAWPTAAATAGLTRRARGSRRATARRPLRSLHPPLRWRVG